MVCGGALMRTHFVIATPYLIRGWQSRRRSNGGSLTCVSLIEIATWFDRLTMSGCAPRNGMRLRLPPSPLPSPIKGEGVLRQAQDEREGKGIAGGCVCKGWAIAV